MIVKPSNPQKLISLLREKPLILYGFGGAGNSIARWCSENQIDYIFADQHAVQKQKDTDKAVIFASVATLGRTEYLSEDFFAPDYFDYLVIDDERVIIGTS